VPRRHPRAWSRLEGERQEQGDEQHDEQLAELADQPDRGGQGHDAEEEQGDGPGHPAGHAIVVVDAGIAGRSGRRVLLAMIGRLDRPVVVPRRHRSPR